MKEIIKFLTLLILAFLLVGFIAHKVHAHLLEKTEGWTFLVFEDKTRNEQLHYVNQQGWEIIEENDDYLLVKSRKITGTFSQGKVDHICRFAFGVTYSAKTESHYDINDDICNPIRVAYGKHHPLSFYFMTALTPDKRHEIRR